MSSGDQSADRKEIRDSDWESPCPPISQIEDYCSNRSIDADFARAMDEHLQAVAPLFINTDGGNVGIGGGSSIVTINGTVNLPTSAVSASEIFDEPGVASNVTNGLLLSSGLQQLASRQITVPADGYILAIGSCEAQFTGCAIDPCDMSADFGISTSNLSLPATQDRELRMVLGTNPFYTPVTVNGLFSVNAGATSFYFLGRKNLASGSVDVWEVQLTLIYIPTSYGTVQPTFAGGDSGPEDNSELEWPEAERPHPEHRTVQDQYAADGDASATWQEQRIADLEQRIADLEAILMEDE